MSWENVKKKQQKNKIYTCTICDFHYKTKGLAEKCKQWCKNHKSCNLKITKHAVLMVSE